MTSKVFVGNLAFQTTDQALAEAFQDCGKVKSGVVITRGRRSLGYGFVEFESPESAIEAVKSKNNIELKGRHLKVELASDNPVRVPNEGPGGGNPAGGQGSSSNQSGGNNPGSGDDLAGGGNDGPRQFRPRRNFQNRGDRNNNNNNKPRKVKAVVVDNTQNPKNPNSNNPTGGNINPSGVGGSNPGGRREGREGGGGRPPRGSGNFRAQRQFQPQQQQQQGGQQQQQQQQGGQQPAQRPPRTKRPPQANYPPVENRVLSKTAVFVANLPFNVKDEELLNFFKDHKPKAAHVVQTRTGRSRGYGFVDFETENDQQGAILSKNNLMFPPSDRQITVTASYKTETPI